MRIICNLDWFSWSWFHDIGSWGQKKFKAALLMMVMDTPDTRVHISTCFTRVSDRIGSTSCQLWPGGRTTCSFTPWLWFTLPLRSLTVVTKSCLPRGHVMWAEQEQIKSRMFTKYAALQHKPSLAWGTETEPEVAAPESSSRLNN